MVKGDSDPNELSLMITGENILTNKVGLLVNIFILIPLYLHELIGWSLYFNKDTVYSDYNIH